MNFKPIGIALAIIVIFSSIVLVGAISQDDVATGTNQGSRNQIGTSPHGIIFTEAYSLGCPKCKQHHDQYLGNTREQYKDQIVFKLKHFPLKSSWPHVLAGHRAVEAAAKQDKFWEMHDRLYEIQLEWRDESNPLPLFKEIAGELGMDVDQFETDFKSKEVFDIINNDEKELKAKGVTETPTIFIQKGSDRTEEKVSGDEILADPDQWFTDLLEEFVEDDQVLEDDEPTEEDEEEVEESQETDDSQE